MRAGEYRDSPNPLDTPPSLPSEQPQPPPTGYTDSNPNSPEQPENIIVHPPDDVEEEALAGLAESIPVTSRFVCTCLAFDSL